MEIRGSVQAKFVETPSAKEAVLFANTPSFLLDRLRRDTSASYVAHELGTEEIIDLLRERCEKPPQTPIDLLWAYVFLAALSLKDDLRTFKDRLNVIDMGRLQWGNEIRDAILHEGPPTSFSAVKYQTIRNEHPDATTNVASGKVILTEG